MVDSTHTHTHTQGVLRYSHAWYEPGLVDGLGYSALRMMSLLLFPPSGLFCFLCQGGGSFSRPSPLGRVGNDLDRPRACSVSPISRRWHIGSAQMWCMTCNTRWHAVVPFLPVDVDVSVYVFLGLCKVFVAGPSPVGWVQVLFNIRSRWLGFADCIPTIDKYLCAFGKFSFSLSAICESSV